MRLRTLSLIGALVVGTSGSAYAAEGKEGQGDKSKHDSSPQADRGVGDSTGDDADMSLREDRRLVGTDKSWEVELDAEAHRVFRQHDIEARRDTDPALGQCPIGPDSDRESVADGLAPRLPAAWSAGL